MYHVVSLLLISLSLLGPFWPHGLEGMHRHTSGGHAGRPHFHLGGGDTSRGDTSRGDTGGGHHHAHRHGPRVPGIASLEHDHQHDNDHSHHGSKEPGGHGDGEENLPNPHSAIPASEHDQDAFYYGDLVFDCGKRGEHRILNAWQPAVSRWCTPMLRPTFPHGATGYEPRDRFGDVPIYLRTASIRI